MINIAPHYVPEFDMPYYPARVACAALFAGSIVMASDHSALHIHQDAPDYPVNLHTSMSLALSGGTNTLPDDVLARLKSPLPQSYYGLAAILAAPGVNKP